MSMNGTQRICREFPRRFWRGEKVWREDCQNIDVYLTWSCWWWRGGTWLVWMVYSTPFPESLCLFMANACCLQWCSWISLNEWWILVAISFSHYVFFFLLFDAFLPSLQTRPLPVPPLRLVLCLVTRTSLHRVVMVGSRFYVFTPLLLSILSVTLLLLPHLLLGAPPSLSTPISASILVFQQIKSILSG